MHIDANVDNPATRGEALVCHGAFLSKALLVSVLERIFSFFPSLSAIPRKLIQHSDFHAAALPGHPSQPPIVTFTACFTMYNAPSFISTTARTSVVCARRMLVEMVACPTSGVR